MAGFDVKRIAHYEEIMDRAEQAARQLEDALDGYERVQDDLKALESYYTGPAWKADYAADEKGRLPADLKRGVLSQDGVDHLLERYQDLRERMARAGADRRDGGDDAAENEC